MANKSKNYWEMKQHQYPFQVEVPHLSPQDVDPSWFNGISSGRFLRVPFDGVAHWGFKDQATLDLFNQVSTERTA